MPPRAGPTNEPRFTYLWCIAVNNQLKVLIKPFQLLLPLDSKCDLFFIHLRVAALRLRNLDYSIFFLYKPRSDIPTDLSVENLDTTQVDLSPSACLNPNAIVRCHFPTVEGNDPPGGLVHAVICIDDTTVNLTPWDLGASRFGPIPLFAIRLKPGDNISLPLDSRVSGNDVYQMTGQEPEFVRTFKNSLRARRYPQFDENYSHLVGLMQDVLGSEYNTYFLPTPTPTPTPTSSAPNSPAPTSSDLTRPADDLEFLHYATVLMDKQIIKQSTYRHRKEFHIQALLCRLEEFYNIESIQFCYNQNWPFSLVLELEDAYYKYTPRSDYSIVVNKLPVLILEVSSNSNERDKNRMKLQAASLVRLGNSMINSSSPTFFVMAIYVDDDYIAHEYTFYQKTHRKPDVFYSYTSYRLSDSRDLFKFIFQLYGFVRSMDAMRSSLSGDFERLLEPLDTLCNQMTCLKKPQSGGGTTPQTRSTAAVFRAFNTRALALLKANGYKLSEEPRIWPDNIVKVTKDGLTFASKLLGLKTEERDILESLQRPNPNDNHVVTLTDVISSDDGDIIVMPWLSSLQSLGDCSEDPSVLEAVVMQFLEGVLFLHKFHIAHLDLKPGNILIDGTRPVPRLSIIDFGMSTRVDDEETTVTGFRGTPAWTAPEVGNPNGLVMTYSAIRADRWSCGRMLQHITKTFPICRASFDPVWARLLDSDPSKRPSLDTVVKMLRSREDKRGADNYITKQTHKIMNTDSASINIHFLKPAILLA